MNYTQLTEYERYQIEAFLKAGFTQKAIARELRRSPGTISRELGRNTGLRGIGPSRPSVLPLNGSITTPIHVLQR